MNDNLKKKFFLKILNAIFLNSSKIKKNINNNEIVKIILLIMEKYNKNNNKNEVKILFFNSFII